MRETRPFGLTREEGLGLCVAIAAHVALIAALTLSPLGRKVQPPPQRMTVTIADTIANQSTSPKPDAQAAPQEAPAVGEPAPADQPLPVAVPESIPVPKPAPKPLPRPKPEPKPVPKPAPEPKPVPKPEPKPRPEPTPKPEPKLKHETKPKPEHKPIAKVERAPKPEPKAKAEPKAESKSEQRAKADAKTKPATKPAGGDTHARPHPDKRVGADRIGDILNGIAVEPSSGKDKSPPADKPAPLSSASVVSAISRQIKPHWTAPQGADAEKLVTVIGWSLNADGSLAGRPVVISQSGITDSNRPQAQRHAELAIRAVQLAAPFNLPAQAYTQFKRFEFRFDRKLSQ